MNVNEEIDQACYRLQRGETVRVNGKAAKQMLVNNTSITLNDDCLMSKVKKIRFLRLLHLGMGVYEVSIAASTCADKTILLKK